MAVSDRFIDYRAQVLAATNIVDLIGRSVALKRMGRNFVGLCPFHQEKSPSFQVNSERQFFYCFGCKAKGNAIDFVMQRDRIEFVDALNQLGEQAGIERPQARGGSFKQKAGEKALLLEAESAACALFEKALAHPDQGSFARAYIQQRGISTDSVKRFQIGYAPDAWDTMTGSSMLRKFKPEQLAMAGLVKRKEGSDRYYDAFRHRLMFPIRDENGRVTAFGGRILRPEDIPKYLNSGDSPIFNKSRSLFGIDLARQKIIESRTVVVVEGYTDVVMAHQFGAANVVSPMGTALAEQHVAVLRRFADRIVLLFDGDSAGDREVDRLVGLFITQPVEIAIAQLEAGLDPDEFLLKRGLAAFEKLIAGAPDALAFKWSRLSQQFNADGSMTGQQKAVDAYLSMLSDARKSGPVDTLRWGAALQRVSRMTQIPAGELHRRFGTNGKPTPSRSPAQASRRPAWPAERFPSARERAERWILGVLLIQPQRWSEVQRVVAAEDFTLDGCRALADVYWCYQRDQGEPVFNAFLGVLADPSVVTDGATDHSSTDGAGESGEARPDLQQLAIELVEEAEALPDPEAMLQEAIAYLDSDRLSREHGKLLAEMRRTDAGMSEQDEKDLLMKLYEKARKPDLRRA